MTHSGPQLDQQFRSGIADANASNLVSMVIYLRDLFAKTDPYREHFHAIFLDHRQSFLSEFTLGSGGQTSLSLRMRCLFAHALQVDARSLILAHNHPSGHCHPSASDIVATKQIIHFAKAVDIDLIDHLIITQTRAYSMRAGGHL